LSDSTADEKVIELVRTHIQRYKEIEVKDIYRLLHQAVFGSGHPITAVKSEREWLEREAEIATPDAKAALLENIHPEKQLVRLHLRPYLSAKGDLKKLLDAFVASSKTIKGDPATMEAYWGIVERMTAPNGELANRFDAHTVQLIGRTRAQEHWPASHHSPSIVYAYKPIYRVMTLNAAQELLSKQKIAAKVI
jgi:hypothetical protein